MAQVTVSVNGKPYVVGCEDGQEGHVAALARDFDQRVRDVGAQVGAVGELRLFLMGALVTADETLDLRARLAEAEAALAAAKADPAIAEAKGMALRAAEALDAAAERIEALTLGLD